MRFFCAFLLLFILSCSNTPKKRSGLIDFTPKNTSFIIKTSNFESLKSTISNTIFLNKISKNNLYKNLEERLKTVSHLKPSSTLLICFSEDLNDSLHFSVITKYNAQLFNIDSLPNYKEETLSYKNKTITKSTLNNQHFYSTVIDSTFFASTSKDIVQDAFNHRNKNIDLEKIYDTTDDKKTCSIIIKSDTSFIKPFTVKNSLSLNIFTNYSALDIDMNQNEIFINGITKATDSLNSAINIFKNTVPQENKTQNITPSNSDGFMSLTANNFKTILTNLAVFTKKDSIPAAYLFDDIIEIGVIYQGKNKAIVLNSSDNIATTDALISQQNIRGTYRGVTLFNFSKPTLFSNSFSPFITFKRANMYCVLDDFFVFTNTIDMMHNIIANYQNKTTLNEKKHFQDIKTYLNDESSLMYVVNPSMLNLVLNEIFEEKTKYKLQNYHSSALQFIYDTDFAHVNGIIKNNKNKMSSNSISEELNIKLDADLLNNPQFVTNHVSKQKDIAVQDINNTLYLISNKGKILWKKQLSGPVLGDIKQIDMYKNGRLQLAFATPNKLYVIDKNGKNVTPFPESFNDKITQPLAVFDYEKNKNYRLLVTQNKKLLMYDARGKIVNGFTFKSANNSIISEPKHFRIGTKDYITFKTKSKLYILDRTGRTRVTPKTTNLYSNQPVFLYKNNFTTTTLNGNLISVGVDGSVSLKNLNLPENHYLQTTSKTLITQSENILNIKSHTVNLDYGNYSSPSLFYINDKIYVSITDLQSHKVYLYDSQSKLRDNFPVYGNCSIILDNIDTDKNLEFITKGDNNSIILYQIN